MSVTASPASGTYSSSQSVSLFSTNGNAIVYTVDGSDPTIESAIDSISTKTLPLSGQQFVVCDEGGVLYACQGVYIYVSRDSGATWTIAYTFSDGTSASPAQPEGSAHFADGVACFYNADSGTGIVYTKDAGISWEVLTLPSGTNYTHVDIAVIFADGMICVQLAETTNWTRATYKTSDYGVTWTQIENSLPIGTTIVIKNTGELVKVNFSASTPMIYWSDDRGSTWTHSIEFTSEWMIFNVVDFIIGNLHYGVRNLQLCLWDGTTMNAISIVEDSGSLSMGTGLSGRLWLVYYNSSGVYSLVEYIPSHLVITNGNVYWTPLSITSSITIKAMEIASSTSVQTFAFIIVILTDYDKMFGNDNLPNDSLTLEMIDTIKPFMAKSGRQRITTGAKRPVFSTTLSYNVDKSTLDSMIALYEAVKDVEFAFQSFPVGNKKVSVLSTSAYSATYNEFGGIFGFSGKLVFEDDTPSIPESNYPRICPFPLPVETLSGSEILIPLTADDQFASSAVNFQRGVLLTAKWYTSAEGMYQFLLWWWKYLGCGRQRFIANIYTYLGWLFTFASAPSFAMQNSFYTVAIKVYGHKANYLLEFTSDPSLSQSASSTLSLIPTSGSMKRSIWYDASAGWRIDNPLHSVAFYKDGTPVPQSLWNGAWHTDHVAISIGALPSGDYRFCIYGASLISKWYLIHIA